MDGLCVLVGGPGFCECDFDGQSVQLLQETEPRVFFPARERMKVAWDLRGSVRSLSIFERCRESKIAQFLLYLLFLFLAVGCLLFVVAFCFVVLFACSGCALYSGWCLGFCVDDFSESSV